MPTLEKSSDPRPDDNLRPFVKRVLIALVIVGVAVAVGELLIHAVWAFLVLYAGVLFGIFLHDVSRWISRWTRLPYSAALGLIVLLLLVATGGFLYYMGTAVTSEAGKLGAELNKQVQRLYDHIYQQLHSYEWLQQYLPEQRPTLLDLFPTSAVSMANVTWLFNQIVWFLGGIVVIFFSGLYLAADPDRYEQGIIKLVPVARRGRTREVLSKLHQVLGQWILARLISMAIIGLLTGIGLAILGVPFAVTLGILAAMLTFVPNIGPIVALVPQALMALQVGPTTVLYVILFNLLLQGIESYLVTPLVDQYEVSLPPVLTITMQVALGMVFGVLGVVLAAPLETAVMVLVQMLYVHDVLGDPAPGELTDAQA